MLATVLSVVAIVAAFGNFLYTQWRSDRREIEKWHRDELLRLVGSLLQLSSRRQVNLLAELGHMEGSDGRPVEDTDSFELTRQMRYSVEQLALLDDRVAAAANAVYQLHLAVERKSYPNEDPYEDVGQLVVEQAKLTDAHAELTQAFRKTTKMAHRQIGVGQPS